MYHYLHQCKIFRYLLEMDIYKILNPKHFHRVILCDFQIPFVQKMLRSYAGYGTDY